MNFLLKAWMSFCVCLSFLAIQIEATFKPRNLSAAATLFPIIEATLALVTILLPQLDTIVKQCRFWTGQPMIDIFRPTQPLDGRVVYRSEAGTVLAGNIHLWLGVIVAILGLWI